MGAKQLVKAFELFAEMKKQAIAEAQDPWGLADEIAGLQELSDELSAPPVTPI